MHTLTASPLYQKHLMQYTYKHTVNTVISISSTDLDGIYTVRSVNQSCSRTSEL